MKKNFIVGAVIGLMLVCLSSRSQASVLTFDDFSTTTTVELLAGSGYGGFHWVNFGATYGPGYPGTGYDLGTVTGDYVATAWGTVGAKIEDLSSSFDFIGAYFTSAYAATNELTITGSNAGTQLYSATITINNTTPLWFQADWTGVDLLSFDFSGQQIAMDDLTFQSATVPIPSTMLLFGTGLVGLVGTRLRKKKK